MYDDRTDEGSAPEGDALEDDALEDRASTSRVRGPTLSQRFEESRIGVWVISAVIVVILGAQVVASVPDSPIRRGLMPVAAPTHFFNLLIPWAPFSGNPNQRLEDFEVQVTMADGNVRTWKVVPHSTLEKIVLPDRWEAMQVQAMRQQDGRKEFARWVVGQVTGPSDRPVKVVMVFHYRALARPGQESLGKTGTTVLYEEVLTP